MLASEVTCKYNCCDGVFSPGRSHLCVRPEYQLLFARAFPVPLNINYHPGGMLRNEFVVVLDALLPVTFYTQMSRNLEYSFWKAVKHKYYYNIISCL